MQIVPYRTEHLPALRTILEHVGWSAHHVTMTALSVESLALRPGCAVFVAEEESGAALGFVTVEHYAWNNLAQVQGLAVEPQRQRTGIALALVQRAEHFAAERGARGIFVDTPSNNRGGRAFYLAAGYAEGYLMPRYYDDDSDGVTYQKFFR